jgi:hypothetical protein
VCGGPANGIRSGRRNRDSRVNLAEQESPPANVLWHRRVMCQITIHNRVFGILAVLDRCFSAKMPVKAPKIFIQTLILIPTDCGSDPKQQITEIRKPKDFTQLAVLAGFAIVQGNCLPLIAYDWH